MIHAATFHFIKYYLSKQNKATFQRRINPFRDPHRAEV